MFRLFPDQSSCGVLAFCQNMVHRFIAFAFLAEASFFKCWDIEPVSANFVRVVECLVEELLYLWSYWAFSNVSPYCLVRFLLSYVELYVASYFF